MEKDTRVIQAVTAYVGGSMKRGLLYYCSKRVVVPDGSQDVLLSAIIYFERYSSSSSTCSMSHVSRHHSTRMEALHTSLLCDCHCNVSATKSRARELEGRCDTDGMIGQQQQAEKKKQKLKCRFPAHTCTDPHTPTHTHTYISTHSA